MLINLCFKGSKNVQYLYLYIYFSIQFNNNNNNNNNKIFVQLMGSIRPMWVGLSWTYVMVWVEFFFTHHGGLGQKILLT